MTTNAPHQFETIDERRARWEEAAHEAGREVDRNALAAYMAVADAEQRALADDWARSVASTDAEISRLRAEADELRGENAKLIRWHSEDGAYEQRLREQHDRDVAELNRLRARVWELERPAIEKHRNEIRDSYAQSAAMAREDRDFEGASNLECQLREREEQWKAEDAANRPEVPAADGPAA